MGDTWKDPEVKAALKEGRMADDIMVLECPRCNEWRYYNQGSGFYCRKCKVGFRVLGEDEEPGDTEPIVYAHEAITLADTVCDADIEGEAPIW